MSKAFKEGACDICGEWGTLSHHHIFTGSNKWISEKYNEFVWADWACHVTNADSIHNNAELRNRLKAEAQLRIMVLEGWTEDEWRVNIFKSENGESWLMYLEGE